MNLYVTFAPAPEATAAEGEGIAVVEGRMIENLHAEEARRVLALHAAISRDK